MLEPRGQVQLTGRVVAMQSWMPNHGLPGCRHVDAPEFFCCPSYDPSQAVGLGRSHLIRQLRTSTDSLAHSCTLRCAKPSDGVPTCQRHSQIVSALPAIRRQTADGRGKEERARRAVDAPFRSGSALRHLARSNRNPAARRPAADRPLLVEMLPGAPRLEVSVDPASRGRNQAALCHR